MAKIDEYKHPKWQEMRLKVMARDGFMCYVCGDKEKTLHVHHKRYAKNKKLWECDPDDLETLCESCHKDVEDFVSYAREKGPEMILVLDKVLGIAKPIDLLKMIMDSNMESLSPKEQFAAEFGVRAFSAAFEYRNAG